jgi:molybdenum cofactor cytidylyltransferase
VKKQIITGILLAAGRSRRFGEDKLLFPLPGGTPIGVASARLLREAVDRVTVVVGDSRSSFAQLLAREDLAVAECVHADEGMGASLAHGVRATAGSDGWIIALADMPYIQTSTIRLVADALRQGAPLAAPSYKGRRGHPVGFSHAFYDALIKLTSDMGARSVVHAHRDQLVRVPVSDHWILHDIDTVHDLR